MTSQTDVIEQLEAVRWKANLATDIATLETLLSDRLEYIHPTSKVDTKESFLAGLQVRNPYLKYEVLEQTILPLGDTAVVTRAFQVTARRDPPENSALVRIRSTAVWTLEGSDWRLIRYQTTFIP
jgi:hypothetical protein